MNSLDLANHTPVYDELGRIVSLAEREALRLMIEGDPEFPAPRLGIIETNAVEPVDWRQLPFGVGPVRVQETSGTDAQSKSPENS